MVAFKMAAGKAVRAGLAERGRISESIRNRRATQPPAHFNATLRAAAGWLFFRVAHSLRINFRYARRPARIATRSVAGGSRLEKQPTDLRPYASYI